MKLLSHARPSLREICSMTRHHLLLLALFFCQALSPIGAYAEDAADAGQLPQGSVTKYEFANSKIFPARHAIIGSMSPLNTIRPTGPRL